MSNNEDGVEDSPNTNYLTQNFKVSIIVGLFSNGLEIEYIKKDNIAEIVEQAKNFIYNSLNGFYIKDLNEGRELQEKIN